MSAEQYDSCVKWLHCGYVINERDYCCWDTDVAARTSQVRIPCYGLTYCMYWGCMHENISDFKKKQTLRVFWRHVCGLYIASTLVVASFASPAWHINRADTCHLLLPPYPLVHVSPHSFPLVSGHESSSVRTPNQCTNSFHIALVYQLFRGGCWQRKEVTLYGLHEGFMEGSYYALAADSLLGFESAETILIIWKSITQPTTTLKHTAKVLLKLLITRWCHKFKKYMLLRTSSPLSREQCDKA